MKVLSKAARLPVVLAVAGAFLNSADLLSEFQTPGREWVGYVAALSLSVALFICIEAFLHNPSTVTAMAVLGFGLAEVATQVLHGGLIRGDVVILTDALRWFMAYLAPSFVVIVGITMPFIVRWGFGLDEPDSSPELAALRSDVSTLTEVVRQQAMIPASVPAWKNGNGNKQHAQLQIPELDGVQNKSGQLELSELEGVN